MSTEAEILFWVVGLGVFRAITIACAECWPKPKPDRIDQVERVRKWDEFI